MTTRTESDLLGAREVPGNSLWGIQTLRALENFNFSPIRIPPDLIHAMILVKKAACRTNLEIGALPEPVGRPILLACDALLADAPMEAFPIDAVQGGAGASTHMNVNEVIANRALDILGQPRGRYDLIHPIEHVNLHQSTHDVYPTALRMAAIWKVRQNSERLAGLQRAFQDRETAFAGILKLGRTEWQPAVPIPLGAEFSAFAEAFARDRWRMAKCEERLRQVNLGGAALGTGLTAPRDYAFRVVEVLRELSELGLARSENLVDATANADAFAEVAGILGACAANFLKVSGDLRFLHLLGEIRLPAAQPGSTIMPGPVNPVILEAVLMCALRIRAEIGLVEQAVAMGTLQINEFMPCIALSLLSALDLCGRAAETLSRHTARIEANSAVCADHLENQPSLIALLVPELGYQKTSDLAKEFSASGKSDLREFLAGRIGTGPLDRAGDLNAQRGGKPGHPSP